MSILKLTLYIAVMAAITYLIRMLPLVVFKSKITNQFVLSFLHYIPFAVLGAMTFPAVFFSTGSVYSAVIGVGVAVILSLLEKDLLTVAVFACISVFVSQFVGGLIF